MLEAAVLTAIGIIWILSRFNLKRVAGYATFWDITITGFLSFIFIGTYAGMVTGMAAGVLISAFLTIVGRTAGKERLKMTRYEGEMIAKPRWRPIP